MAESGREAIPGQLPADPVHMCYEGRQSPIQVLRKDAYLLGVVSQGQLAPAIGNGFEQSDKTGRCCEDDVLRKGVLYEVRLFIQRRAQELVAGNEQDDELRAL